jgi:CBS domain-containing protein
MRALLPGPCAAEICRKMAAPMSSKGGIATSDATIGDFPHTIGAFPRHKKRLLTIGCTDNVLTAIRRMRAYDVSALVVTEERKGPTLDWRGSDLGARGILSERDLMRYLEYEPHAVQETTVQDILERQGAAGMGVPCITSATSIAEAMATMTESSSRQLLLVNQEAFEGLDQNNDQMSIPPSGVEDIITIRDLLRYSEQRRIMRLPKMLSHMSQGDTGETSPIEESLEDDEWAPDWKMNAQSMLEKKYRTRRKPIILNARIGDNASVQVGCPPPSSYYFSSPPPGTPGYGRCHATAQIRLLYGGG